MSLKRRLHSLVRKESAPPTLGSAPIAHPSSGDLKQRMQAMEKIRGRLRESLSFDENDPVSFYDICDWQRISMPSGTAYERVRIFEGNAKHGAVSLAPAFERSPRPLAEASGDHRLKNFDLTDALFVDIEATGLSHGSGTYAFCIGTAAFGPDGRLTLRQLVLDDPSNELPMLERFQQLLEERQFLISFNGKSYDTTVLQSRLIIHRLYSSQESELKLTPHLDLLHTTRAIWRKLLPDGKLQTLEKRLLHLHREDDVPGELVPTLYFNYLHSGDARPLVPIIEHNDTDVVSMAALVGVLLDLLHEPSSYHEPGAVVGVARLLHRRGAHNQAMRTLEHALKRPLALETLREALQLAIKLYKRLREHHRLYPVLATYRDAFPDEPFVWIELAKHFEHRERNFSEALRCAQHAATLFETWQREETEALDKRISRLARRTRSASAP